VKPNRRRLAAVGPIAATALVAAAVAVPAFVVGSSHREGPQISQDPTVDNTDVYFHRSPDKPDTVTMIANYLPMEEPAGGPNFYTLSDKANYEIKLDNTGDGNEDITWRFRFKTTFKNPNSFLYATGPVTFDPKSGTYNNLNVTQTYTVQKITTDKKGRRIVRTIGRNLQTPPNNVGPKTTPNYPDLANAAIYRLADGSKVFAGQRDDPFPVDLGSVFDLVNIDKPGRPGIGIGNMGGGDDAVTGFNVHSIALQVPISMVTRNGKVPTDASDPKSVVGIYASADRPVVSFRDGRPVVRYQQVSRLAQPLINEVVIPIGKKDFWNGSDPSRDSQFAGFYRTPELAGALNALFPGVTNCPVKNRDDLVSVLLTGLPPGNPFGLVTQIGRGKPTQADLLRLNLAVKPTPPAQQNRLGVLAGPLDGFPNRRRLIDDIVDIELQAVCGVLVRPMGQTPQLGDGVDLNDLPSLAQFPYVPHPISGFDKRHPRPSTFS
jgi:hypothetical protein